MAKDRERKRCEKRDRWLIYFSAPLYLIVSLAFFYAPQSLGLIDIDWFRWTCITLSALAALWCAYWAYFWKYASKRQLREIRERLDAMSSGSRTGRVLVAIGFPMYFFGTRYRRSTSDARPGPPQAGA